MNEKCVILFSPTFGKIDPSLIVEWILEGDIPVRMQLQMHKHIWEPKEKGVWWLLEEDGFTFHYLFNNNSWKL